MLLVMISQFYLSTQNKINITLYIHIVIIFEKLYNLLYTLIIVGIISTIFSIDKNLSTSPF